MTADSAARPLPAARPPALPMPRAHLRQTGVFGALASVALFAGFGLWAGVTFIDSAIHAGGQAIVRGKPKLVQSLDGGVVEVIAVRDGERVAAGDLLMRLDPTLLQMNLDTARTRLAEALARRARLEAEDQSLVTPVYAYPDLPVALPDTARPQEGQSRIFAARQALNEGRRARLVERMAEAAQQIAGLDASIAAKEEQLGYIDRELANSLQLQAQGLVRESQVLALQRSRAEMVGTLGETRAERARVETSARDAAIEADQADREFREQVVTDLRATQTEIEELMLQIATLSRQIARVDIRAPAPGIVHEMQITTLGGVVAPGGTVMQIIPLGEGLEFELKLDPKDIDQVHPSQKAQVVFAAFDSRSTPRLSGEVTTVSAAAIPDESSGKSFYRIGLKIAPGEIDRLKGAEIRPGMPIEAFLETGEHSVMDYLLQPLTSQILRAFRES